MCVCVYRLYVCVYVCVCMCVCERELKKEASPTEELMPTFPCTMYHRLILMNYRLTSFVDDDDILIWLSIPI